MMMDELSTSSGRSSPDQPILVPVPPIEDPKPRPRTPSISMFITVLVIIKLAM